MSSGASQIQLFALGDQDIHLTGTPQFSYFKKVYRRHTHYAIEQLRIPLQDSNNATIFGRQSDSIITKQGDLLHKLYLHVDLECQNGSADPTYTVGNFKNTLIQEAFIEIGGRRIEEYNSQFKQMKSELLTHDTIYYKESEPTHGGKGFDTDYDNIDTKTRYEGNVPLFIKGDAKKEDGTQVYKKIIYEFDFWFTRDIGHSLPLNALYNHDIRLGFTFETKNNLLGSTQLSATTPTGVDINILKTTLYGDFIRLSNEESRRFRQSNHNYLIEQTQYGGSKETSNDCSGGILNPITYELEFQNPVKYLLWGITNPGSIEDGGNKGRGPTYFISQTYNSRDGNDGLRELDKKATANLKIENMNMNDEDTPITFYTRTTPMNLINNMAPLDTVAMFSFARLPFDNQPSGTCNFSRLNSSKSKLTLTFSSNAGPVGENDNNDDNLIIKKKPLHIFAVNYNIFSISSGMGGLLFSN